MSAIPEPAQPQPQPHPRREWWWLALAWALLGVLLAADLWQEHGDIGARERQHLVQQAAILHDNLVPQLDAANHAMNSLLADLPRLSGLADGGARLSLRLHSYADAMPAVQSVTLIDAGGRSLAASNDALVGRDFSARDYFIAARRAGARDTLVVSPPFRGSLGRWVIVLARVVPSADGHFGGVLAMALDAQYFRTLLQSVRYAPAMTVSLAHGDGERFLAVGRAETGEGMELNHADSPLRRHLSGGHEASLLVGSMWPGDGLRQLVALRTVRPATLHMDKPLVVAVGRDETEILAAWRTRLWRAVLGWLAAGAAGVIAVAWVQRRSRELMRQQRELALQAAANQARWDAVLAATALGLWDYEVASGKTHHSVVWFDMLGYAPEDLVGTGATWTALVHPDDRADVQAQWQPFMDGRAPQFNGVYRLRCKDGGYIWCQGRARAITRDGAGRPTRVLGTLADVSEQRRQEELLQRLAENVPGMLYQYQLESDGRSHFPYASAHVVDIYGLSPEELRHDAAPVFARVHPDDLQRGIVEIRRSADALSEWHAEYRVKLPGRGERWLSGHARPRRLASGATLWYGYINDITEHKEQALKLQATERMLRQLISDMPVALCMVDEQLRIDFRNQRFLDDLGWSEQEVPTLHEWALKAYPDASYRAQAAARWQQAKAAAINGQIGAQSYRITARDGVHHVMDVAGLVFGGRLLVTFQDQTAHQAQNELLRKLAYVDGLTGIANRRSFDEALAREWSRCGRSRLPLAVLLMDIDHFKAYNDAYGHQQGDACLRAVAGALAAAAAVRSHDLVARYGGEEFVCLLPECDLAGARAAAERLRLAVLALAMAHAASPVAPSVSLSVGLASQVPGPDATPAELVQRADAHLYRAKSHGRNRVEDGTAS